MLLENASIKNLARGLSELAYQEGETLMVLLAEHSANDVEGMIQFFNERKVTFFGGLFPGLIHGKDRLEEGCIVKKFQTFTKPILVRGISSGELIGFDAVQKIESEKRLTAFTLVDGLTSNINYFLDSLNNHIGNYVKFLGGGAGSLTLKQQPCLFTNEGFFEDAAIVSVVQKKTRLGVRHGWQKLEGPMIATKAEGNVIQQLNWQNAFDVYKSIVEKDAGIAFTDDNFFDLAKSYPFGMFRENLEDIVRDPITTNEEGHLICVGEVPANTVLYILKGETANLIDAAGQAIIDCKGKENGQFKADDTFIIDCISRTLFLEDDFTKELEAVHNQINIKTEEEVPHGILSLGEISSFGKGLLEFFNKTIVVGTLHPL